MPITPILFFGFLIRLLVSLWGYSGHDRPPMYGDFEAQRHWMEITIHLPLGEWYRHSSMNDLQYWGLDYPPVTAYTSYIFGKVAELCYSDLVKFQISRGHESLNGKLFMRGTVILSDLLIFIPSTILSNLVRRDASAIKLLSLISVPSLLLIDHGHFQYNGVCIGLSLMASSAILWDFDVLGSILFCLSLNFKQMSLYYALIFFVVLLRKCITRSTWLCGFKHLLIIGCTVVVSFACLWAPFCLYHSNDDTCSASLQRVLERQFPFSRGIFEDKVANLWYTLSVLYDFRSVVAMASLTKLSIGLTLVLISPTLVYLSIYQVNFTTMILGLVNGSLSFFLASFQVHEKSLLLALVPASLLVSEEPLITCWFQIIGSFTMFPLLIKDGLRIPYWACNILYCSIVALHCALEGDRRSSSAAATLSVSSAVKVAVVGVSVCGALILHLMEALLAPPPRYPDLYPALFSIYGCVNLVLFYIIFTVWLFLQREHILPHSNIKISEEKAVKID